MFPFKIREIIRYLEVRAYNRGFKDGEKTAWRQARAMMRFDYEVDKIMEERWGLDNWHPDSKIP